MVGGFTFIELMIVITVIGIIMAIAVASYGFAMVKSRRGAAKGCLMESAQFVERYYTTNMTYFGVAFPNLACRGDLGDHYQFSLDGAATATAYRLRAVPTAAQDDGLCGTLSINQTGTKSETGTGDVDACW